MRTRGRERVSTSVTEMTTEPHRHGSDQVVATAEMFDSDAEDAGEALVMECLQTKRDASMLASTNTNNCAAVSLHAPALNRLLVLQKGEKLNVGAGKEVLIGRHKARFC